MQNDVVICNCCGFSVHSAAQDAGCPRCHYPLAREQEMAFLHTELYNLQRVSAYGGAAMTVSQLIRRYQQRLATLAQPVPQTYNPSAVTPAPAPLPTPPVAPVQVPSSHTARPAFSFRVFFADQSINIIALLGAFFILVGSLSFIITTPDLWLSFITLLLVHGLFGVVGLLTRRFASLRTVSLIYTTIFALQVPLIGFSAYRFLSGNTVLLSNSVIIAIAALYAALVYGALALYQRFKSFAYLAVIALVVVDLACSAALALSVWWWLSGVFVLALPLLFLLPRVGTTRHNLLQTIFAEPVRVFLALLVFLSVCGLLMTTAWCLLFTYGPSFSEARFSLVCLLGVSLVWFACFVLRTSRYSLLPFAPLHCAFWVLSLCYAFSLSPQGYALALTGLAISYTLATFFCTRTPLVNLRGALHIVALFVVAIVPLIVFPQLPFALFLQTYIPSLRLPSAAMPWLELTLVLAGMALVLTILFSRTGLHKVVAPELRHWRWLLLLAGALLNFVFAVLFLALGIPPVWGFAGNVLFYMLLVLLVRRFGSDSWANPLEWLAFVMTLEALFFSFALPRDSFVALALALSVLWYGFLFLVRRSWALIWPVGLACLALYYLSSLSALFLVLALVLPLLAVALHAFVWRFARKYGQVTPDVVRYDWEWPLLLTAVVYGFAVLFDSYVSHRSALQPWFEPVLIPAACDALLLALGWCVAATLARAQFWQLATVIFAGLGVWLLPQMVTCTDPAHAICTAQATTVLFALATVGIATGLLAALLSLFQRVVRRWSIPSWPWHVISAWTMVFTLFWLERTLYLLPIALAFGVIGLFLAVLVMIMFVRRVPEYMLAVVVLALWMIGHAQVSLWQQMLMYCALALMVFVAQFVWRVLPSEKGLVSARALYNWLALSGLFLVLCSTLVLSWREEFFSWELAQTGAFEVALFSGLLAAYGLLQSQYSRRRASFYLAGLFLSLLVSWELLVTGNAQLATLWLAPASYLLLLSPFIANDADFEYALRWSQFCALSGAALLLLPTLWLSFTEQNLLPTLLLGIESLLLFALGLVTRVRTYVLSGIALVIVSALHLLFLPSLAIPTFLALSLAGGVLLLCATLLVLVRGRLTHLWVDLH